MSAGGDWPTYPGTDARRTTLDRATLFAYLRGCGYQVGAIIDATERVAPAPPHDRHRASYDARTVAAIRADLAGWSPADADLLTTVDAARVADMTPDAFRKAVSRPPNAILRQSRVFLDGRTPLYPRAVVAEWHLIRRRIGKPR
jgi:hypothetical protein